MRAILQSLPQIEKLSQPLSESLKALKASIAACFDKEHQADGAHADVTATTLTVSGTTVLGKVNLRSVTYVEPGGTGGTLHNFNVAGLIDVACLRIIPESSPLQITGIDATGRAKGDLLLLLNCDYDLDPADIQLLGENTNSLAANRFVDTTASGSGAAGTVVIQGARGVWLMYDYQERETNSTPLGGRWRILDPTF